MRTHKIALTGILAAVICLIAPFSLPTGTVPFSFTTLAIYIIACTVKTKYSVSAVAVYILLGATGLPVFSSFQGGFHLIAGVTGGFILGYIPCALIIGLLVNRFENSKFIFPVSMLIGTAFCYLSGTLWYMLQTGADFKAAAAICILPFIIGDIVKISVACASGTPLRKRLAKFL